MSKGITLPPIQKKPNQNLVNCRFFPPKHRGLFESPVMCDQTTKLCSGHCDKCGWNPLVKAARLTKMFGRARANFAVAYSASITDGTNGEYNRRWKNYRPTREEP